MNTDVITIGEEQLHPQYPRSSLTGRLGRDTVLAIEQDFILKNQNINGGRVRLLM